MRLTSLAWCLKASTPFFHADGLTMPLPWMQRRPASITSHLELSAMMGTRAMSGSDAMSCREPRHGGLAVEHGLVHVDVDDLRAVLHLLARHGHLFILAVQNHPRKRLGAGDVGALAHVDEQGVPDRWRRAPGQRVSWEDGDSRRRAHLCRNTDKTGERRCDGAKAGRPSLTAASHHRGVESGCRCNAPGRSGDFKSGTRPYACADAAMAQAGKAKHPVKRPVEDKGVAKQRRR